MNDAFFDGIAKMVQDQIQEQMKLKMQETMNKTMQDMQGSDSSCFMSSCSFEGAKMSPKKDCDKGLNEGQKKLVKALSGKIDAHIRDLISRMDALFELKAEGLITDQVWQHKIQELRVSSVNKLEHLAEKTEWKIDFIAAKD